MNFLAHLHLSGNDPEILCGNFIGDSVTKGMLDSYPKGIQTGVMMHRFIDAFTDAHPLTREMKGILKPVAGAYAPVVADIVCDHFLARNWKRFHRKNLPVFVKEATQVLMIHLNTFPVKSQQFFHFMTKFTMLERYGSREGLDFALSGMSRRARFENRMHECGDVVAEHDAELSELFNRYYPLLQQAVINDFPASL